MVLNALGSEGEGLPMVRTTEDYSSPGKVGTAASQVCLAGKISPFGLGGIGWVGSATYFSCC
jgi:hypothetical protein